MSSWGHETANVSVNEWIHNFLVPIYRRFRLKITVGWMAVCWWLGVHSCWHDLHTIGRWSSIGRPPRWRRRSTSCWWCAPLSLDHGHERTGLNVWVATVRKLLRPWCNSWCWSCSRWSSGRLAVISLTMRWAGVWNISPRASAVSLVFDLLPSFLWWCLRLGTVRLVSGKTLAVMSLISIVATPTPIKMKTVTKKAKKNNF